MLENPEFLDDLENNSDGNGCNDVEGPPMGSGIMSRFNILVPLNFQNIFKTKLLVLFIIKQQTQ